MRITERLRGGGHIALMAFAVAATNFAISGCGKMTGGGAGGPAAEDIAKVPAGAVDPKVERYKVPVGKAAVEGPGDAKVTIVEFSDFQ